MVLLGRIVRYREPDPAVDLADVRRYVGQWLVHGLFYRMACTGRHKRHRLIVIGIGLRGIAICHILANRSDPRSCRPRNWMRRRAGFRHRLKGPFVSTITGTAQLDLHSRLLINNRTNAVPCQQKSALVLILFCVR